MAWDSRPSLTFFEQNMHSLVSLYWTIKYVELSRERQFEKRSVFGFAFR